MSRDERLSLPLHDILDMIEELRTYSQGIDLTGLMQDSMRRRAVERCIEIISEASRRMPADWKAEEPQIDWRDIAGIGNILRHDYDGVALDVLWSVVTEQLDPLEQAVRAILKRHPTMP